jgi:nucleoside-diphosphate-sugar epimerase
MSGNGNGNQIVQPTEPILVTGAAWFIGARVVQRLLERGFRNVRCLVRPSSEEGKLEALKEKYPAALQIVRGNLLSREDCAAAVKEVAVVYHLAAGRGQKLVADAYMNSVVTTRNLLEACGQAGSVRRFVSVSSFSVYSNQEKSTGRLLDETCPMESHPEKRDPYTFAKVRQDEMVAELAKKYCIPFVIVRPGVVYGPGNEAIHGRVGIGTFGVFLHMGGGNSLPLTYVDNCAEAIVLAGLKPGADGEVFNVVDDDLPTSRRFLRLYKRKVRSFRSIYIPRAFSYFLCYLWESYSDWSQGQLPALYNRRFWHVYWKKTCFSNQKLRSRLGWVPPVPTAEALERYFESCRRKQRHA